LRGFCFTGENIRQKLFCAFARSSNALRIISKKSRVYGIDDLFIFGFWLIQLRNLTKKTVRRKIKVLVLEKLDYAARV